MRYDFEDAAHRIPRTQRQVNLILHAYLRIRIDAAQQDFFFSRHGLNRLPGHGRVELGASDGDHVAQNFDAQFA